MDARSVILAACTLILFALHQDFWNWRTVYPLVFGFLPIGLAYHDAYTLAAAAWLAVLVKWAWPAHLEEDRQRGPEA